MSVLGDKLRSLGPETVNGAPERTRKVKMNQAVRESHFTDFASYFSWALLRDSQTFARTGNGAVGKLNW